MLQIENLNKTYENGVRSLHNLSLTVSKGMFGLLGPNGAGKSTLMRTIAALQKPDSGSILFKGINIIEDPLQVRKQLGYLPQDFGVYPRISALQLLDHLAVLKGITNKKERKQQVAALLEQTNLQHHRHKAVHSFSGGMRQRFGIAQALLGNPSIIIADEPTAGLDPEERNRFNNLLSEIGEEIVVILSTHIVEDVRDLCSNMAVMLKGSIVMQGNPADMINQIRGMVWSKTITKPELTVYRERYQLISSRLQAGRLTIHVLSAEQPGEGFDKVLPDLEDVYFCSLFHHQFNSVTHA